MQGKLDVYEHQFTGAVGGKTIEVLEIERVDGFSNKPALTLAVARPKTIQFYTFQAGIRYTSPYGEPIGRLDCAEWLYDARSYVSSWRWWLTPLELTQLETWRNGNDLSVSIEFSGIAQVTDQTDAARPFIPVRGSGTLYIANSDWGRILNLLEYPPAQWVPLPLESQHWPNWPQARERMNKAVCQ